MNASIHDHKVQQTSGNDRPLAQSVFRGEARLRELEHLAENARKVRDHAAAELTRSSGATHHIARERMGTAERMLRKTRQEIAELRAQLAQPVTGTGAPQTSISQQDFELAVLLGHNKGRFNQIGDPNTALELQQDTVHGRRQASTSMANGRQTKSGASGRHSWTVGLLLALGLGLGAFGTLTLVNHEMMTNAAQVVREGTEQLFIRIRSLLPTSGVTSHNTAKAAFSTPESPAEKQPI